MEFMRPAYGKLTFIGCGNDRHFLEMLFEVWAWVHLSRLVPTNTLAREYRGKQQSIFPAPAIKMDFF